MSMAMRPAPPITSTQSTASFMRERRLLCCSSREPWGTNGFGLFIDLAPMASFLRGGLIFFAAKFSLGKFRGVLNSSGSLASGWKSSQKSKPAGEINTPPAAARLAASAEVINSRSAASARSKAQIIQCLSRVFISVSTWPARPPRTARTKCKIASPPATRTSPFSRNDGAAAPSKKSAGPCRTASA